MFKPLLACLSFLAISPNFAAAWQNPPASELIQWVRDARKAGLEADQIQRNAVKGGWPAAQVDQAIEAVLRPPPATTPEPVAPKLEARAALSQAPESQIAERAETRPVEAAGATGEKASASEPAVNAAPASATSPPPVALPAPGTTATLPAASTASMPYEYRIGEGDVLQISVWNEGSASVPSGVVRPDGMISMPLIKDVHVAGLTPAEVEKVVTGLLAKHLKAVDVTVIVGQINSKKVFIVGGGVKREGPIAYTYRMTVMQALSEAGGLSDYAKRKKIYILRDENGRQYKLPFDYDAVLNGQRMELNRPLLPGDTLVVPNH